MAAENWKVVGDAYCRAWLQRAIEPESGQQLLHNKFFMDIRATIWRCVPQHPVNFDDDISLFLNEDNWSVEESEATIELQSNKQDDMRTEISRTLSDQFQVPCHAHEDMVDTIIYQAVEAEREYRSDGPKVFGMAVRIDIYVADWNFMDRFGSMDVAEAFDDGRDEPTFVPASDASIEMLEKVNVEFSTTCSVCMEEIRVDSEATRMPCLHIFDEDCIVKWLHKSRFCPVCRFTMPADGDQ